MFGRYLFFSYLCRIVWPAPCGAVGELTCEKDVFRRLTCWNRNFAKFVAITAKQRNAKAPVPGVGRRNSTYAFFVCEQV